MSKLTIEELTDAVSGGVAAIRIRQRLQPAGGPGDKVFPPTYATGDSAPLKYAVEDRRIGGESIPCVLLDSVASQANRLEEALLEAWNCEDAEFPVFGVDFSEYSDLVDLGLLTTLQTPHRIADALIRDALTTDEEPLPFRDSEAGRRYTLASTRNATAVYQLCPTALVFGVWDSTGPRGGSGSKFQRALVSEIVGVNYKPGVKGASRIDPTGIQSKVSVYHKADDPSDWTATITDALTDKKGAPMLFSRSAAEGKGKPSSVNHSNVAPSIDNQAGGVTLDYALHTLVLSLPALRCLRFPADVDGVVIPTERRRTVEASVRTALAALALTAVAYQREQGYDLRSRSFLIPEAASPFQLEFVPADGGESTFYEFSVSDAQVLLKAAASAAAANGFAWEREPLKLKPMPKLVELIRASRRLVAETGEHAEAD